MQRICETIAQDGILGRHISIQETTALYVKRCIAHTLHSSYKYDVAFSKTNALGTQCEGFHARCADLVDSGSFRRVRTACMQNYLPSRTLSKISLEHTAQVCLVDVCWLDVRTVDGCFRCGRA